MNTVSKVALGLLYLTLAGLLVRNYKGTATVFNSVTSGYGQLLSTAAGGGGQSAGTH